MKIINFVCFFLFSLSLFSQNEINWISFKDLNESQEYESRAMFVYIYADWCVYCKKMEKVSFKDKSNVNLLNNNYYALKFNLETESDIIFNDKIYKNQELKTHRQPKHELAKFLTRKQNQIPLPVIVIIDKHYNNLRKLHTYLSPKQLFLIINP